jgi:membrane-associated phospholipid phosphatase
MADRARPASVPNISRRVTARDETVPEQEPRGRAFVTVYAALLALATLAFALLAVSVRSEDLVSKFDAPVAQAIQSVHVPIISWVLVHTSDLGWAPYNVLCATVIAVALFVLRLRLESVVIVVSTLVAGGLGTLAKDLAQRSRPSASFVHLAAHLADYSFPSGHVIFATVLFGTAFWVVWVVWSNSLLRDLVLVVLAAPVVLMGLSRVYLGEHWPSDVLGAYCLAGLWVAGTIELLLVLKPRLSPWWQGRPHRRRWRPLM